MSWFNNFSGKVNGLSQFANDQFNKSFTADDVGSQWLRGQVSRFGIDAEGMHRDIYNKLGGKNPASPPPSMIDQKYKDMLAELEGADDPNNPKVRRMLSTAQAGAASMARRRGINGGMSGAVSERSGQDALLNHTNNITNQRMQLLAAMSGREFNLAAQDPSKGNAQALGGLVGGGLGLVAGGMLGGPMGAGVGATAGAGLGAGVGGMFHDSRQGPMSNPYSSAQWGSGGGNRNSNTGYGY